MEEEGRASGNLIKQILQLAASKVIGMDNEIYFICLALVYDDEDPRLKLTKLLTWFSVRCSYVSKNKYEFRKIIGRYDVSVAKKIDQSESVNKPVTKRGLTNIDIDSRIWAPPD